MNEVVDRNAQNNDISRESFDPLTDPLTDPLKNSNTPNNDISGESFDPLTDPRTDPVKNKTCDSRVSQLTVFDPLNDPLTDPLNFVDQLVDRKFSGRGKGFGHFDPLDEKNDQNKKEIIQPHPSFKKRRGNLKIEGMTGNWDVSYRIKNTHIDIEFASPDEQPGNQPDFIQITEKLTYSQFRAKTEGAIWEGD